jgi:sporulation protein YlmC with PRC-barrel domain
VTSRSLLNDDFRYRLNDDSLFRVPCAPVEFPNAVTIVVIKRWPDAFASVHLIHPCLSEPVAEIYLSDLRARSGERFGSRDDIRSRKNAMDKNRIEGSASKRALFPIEGHWTMRMTVLGAVLLAAMAIPALAQESIPASASDIALTTKPRFLSVTESGVLSSNLIGLDVKNAAGETIGQVRDVMLADRMGVAGFILSVGGFLGIGERYVVVEPSAIMVSYDENGKMWRARMNATADQIKVAPAFTYEGKWKS